ncbi:hypothetical protein STAFG_3827 [Streptomyces afghaniensis 772]|uniref:Uncharacterized protein n=1 Tax=Streptomyces afghaniensis 772 TaxID=1283301 RepID=S4MTY9_9ACTN|nr:hypothetical protein STAFG_3827 [Streptomyces afghaniensis 772]
MQLTLTSTICALDWPRPDYRRPRRSVAPRPALADGNRAFLSPTSSMS